MCGGHNLLADLKLQESGSHYRNFVRMSSQDFEFLLNAIDPKIYIKWTLQ